MNIRSKSATTGKKLKFTSLICLIAGATIYILFREPVYFTERLELYFKHLPLVELNDGFLRTVLLYYVPDGLWCVALMFYVTAEKSRWLMISAIICPVALEVLQISENVPGTFDIVDLSIYLIISLIFFSLWKKENLLKRFSTR